MSSHFKTVFSFGNDDGKPRRPLSSSPTIALPPPPSNFHTSQIEQLHRTAYPPPPITVPDYLYADPWSNPFAVPGEADQPANLQAGETDAEAPNIEPAPRDFHAEVAELARPLTDYLTAFVVSEQPDDDFEAGYHNPLDTSKPPQPDPSPEAEGFEARKVDLAAQFRAWSESLAQFLREHCDWSIAQLREQHAAAWREARLQTAVVDGVMAEHSQTTSDLRNAKFSLSKARSAFQAHEAAKPDLDALPSQTDLDSWQAEGLRLKAAWEAADQTVSAVLNRLQDLSRRHERESNKLTALKKVEADLRARLGGREQKELGEV